MQNTKTIRLMDAVKKSLAVLLRNENLGFLAKVAIFVSAISSVLVIISMILQLVPAIAMKSTTGALNRGPSNVYIQNATTGADYSDYNPNYSLANTPLPPQMLPKFSAGSMAIVIIVAVVVALIYVLIGMYTSTISLLAAVKVFDGQIVSIKDLAKEAWTKMFKMMWLSISVGVIVSIGVLLFIVPGIIWMIKYMFSAYFVLRENVSAAEAMKRSKEITSGHKWDLFLKGVGYTLLIMVALLPFIVVAYTLGAFAGILINVITVFTLLFILKSLTEAKAPAVSLEPNATTIA